LGDVVVDGGGIVDGVVVGSVGGSSASTALAQKRN